MSLKNVVMLAHAAAAVKSLCGRGVPVGSWIKTLHLHQGVKGTTGQRQPCMSHDMTSLISCVTGLRSLEITPGIKAHLMLALHKTSSVHTLIDLKISILPDQMSSVLYIGGLRRLKSLKLTFLDAPFHKSTGLQSWDLPDLSSMVCISKHNPESCLVEFLAGCNFPQLFHLELIIQILSTSEATSLMGLYASKRTSLRRFLLYMHGFLFPSVVPQLEQITHLVVINATPSVMKYLPPSVAEIHLCYLDENRTIGLEDVLDGLLGRPFHKRIRVRVEFTSGRFLWRTGQFRYVNLIQLLLQYTFKGVSIADQDDKTVLDYIPRSLTETHCGLSVSDQLSDSAEPVSLT
jgi:hypothetical protein